MASVSPWLCIDQYGAHFCIFTGLFKPAQVSFRLNHTRKWFCLPCVLCVWSQCWTLGYYVELPQKCESVFKQRCACSEHGCTLYQFWSPRYICDNHVWRNKQQSNMGNRSHCNSFDSRVSPPAERITMLERAGINKATFLLQPLDDILVSILQRQSKQLTWCLNMQVLTNTNYSPPKIFDLAEGNMQPLCDDESCFICAIIINTYSKKE